MDPLEIKDTPIAFGDIHHGISVINFPIFNKK